MKINLFYLNFEERSNETNVMLHCYLNFEERSNETDIMLHCLIMIYSMHSFKI